MNYFLVYTLVLILIEIDLTKPARSLCLAQFGTVVPVPCCKPEECSCQKNEGKQHLPVE